MARLRSAGNFSISDLELTTPYGDTVVLGNLIKVPTVVVLARYFG